MNIKIIKSLINTEIKFSYLSKVDSTNKYLNDLEDSFESYKAHLVIAGEQTAGKGRNGNSWFSDADRGIAMSLSLRLDKTTDITLIPITIALILADLLSKNSMQSIKIKWPNDLYLKNIDNFVEDQSGDKSNDYGKFSGILIDANQNESFYKIVIGIGLNLGKVNIHNDDYIISHYQTELSRESLIAKIANSIFEHIIINYPKQIDTNKYHVFDYLANKKVCVSDIINHPDKQNNSENKIIGIAMGVNSNGHLIIKDDKNQYQRIINQKRIRVINQ